MVKVWYAEFPIVDYEKFQDNGNKKNWKIGGGVNMTAALDKKAIIVFRQDEDEQWQPKPTRCNAGCVS